MSVDSSPPCPEKGFPALKWLVGLAFIGLLAGLTLRPIPISHAPSKRNRSVAAHAVIKSGLEQYLEEHGQYPTPAHPDAMMKVSGKDIRVGAARMLYQALTGDGDSEIKSASATGNASDGKISEEEAKHSINSNLPKNMVATSSEGYRYLVDGWGRPFQYIKGGTEDAINPTFDLWTFGDIGSQDPLFYDAETRRKDEAIARWIRNW
ncbi:hypothetical protein [Roseimicrobium sp. ORNL1]|uniref:hypothetical protein n=1 Tax=Roseimicrobium sp. ORNL1 TaxID=2711231 RepID=UPI0013E1E171|nr:hypothetical protein [Roseimicrobium sp. ORNL1]QIF01094.1 hypothetical protein G5S37_06020 [Roseimicrobium sp. ORNL1]